VHNTHENSFISVCAPKTSEAVFVAGVGTWLEVERIDAPALGPDMDGIFQGRAPLVPSIGFPIIGALLADPPEEARPVATASFSVCSLDWPVCARDSEPAFECDMPRRLPASQVFTINTRRSSETTRIVKVLTRQLTRTRRGCYK